MKQGKKRIKYQRTKLNSGLMNKGVKNKNYRRKGKRIYWRKELLMVMLVHMKFLLVRNSWTIDSVQMKKARVCGYESALKSFWIMLCGKSLLCCKKRRY
mmetsp:Transcript_35469/g.72577  ORF Transcript_35469/g.72577 Transcript_35469/m.72577 type:complete len:99 (+) Transcript_35469:725-1021(+)